VPLLGPREKAELESLILERFNAHFDAHGGRGILDPRLRVVVDISGVTLDHGEARDPLAAVEVKGLFTALCYTSSATEAMPRDALASLATEATSATAAIINRIGAG
jgi:hypothetical protein